MLTTYIQKTTHAHGTQQQHFLIYKTDQTGQMEKGDGSVGLSAFLKTRSKAIPDVFSLSWPIFLTSEILSVLYTGNILWITHTCNKGVCIHIYIYL